MTERAIIEAAADLRRQREPYLIATVVGARGSVYRRPGARMLLTRFRWIAGAVSGGCLEGDISRKGWWRTSDGKPVIVSYDSRIPADADDDEVRAAFGLGCDGIVDVMLERAGIPGRIDPLALASRCLADGKRGVVATVVASRGPEVPVGARVAWRAGEEPVGDVPAPLRDEMIADATAAIERGQSCTVSYSGADVFIEVILPPPRLFVFGTGHDAVPVARLARALGWDVTICARQARIATRERFAGHDILVGDPGELAAAIDAHERTAAVVMAHDYDVDRDHVGMLAGTRVRYVGILGPRARTTRMLGELCLGLDDPRIHAPVGLELGAETPEEIALSIVAEIQSALQQAPATSLRERQGPIHVHYDQAVAAAT